MDEQNSTGPEVQSGEQAEVVAPQSAETADSGDHGVSAGGTAESTRNADFAMVEVPDGDTPDGDEKQADGEAAKHPEAKPQTREENAAIRAARLRASRDAEAAAASRADETIAAAGVPNPYTGQPFRSVREVQEYGAKLRDAEIRKQAKSTGRSVEELTEEDADRAFIRQQRRQAEQAQQIAAQRQAQQAFIDQDYQDFLEKYPNIDAAELEKNRDFRRFCGTRFGREPLAQLYGDYQALMGAAADAAKTRSAGRSARSTGGGSAGGAQLSPAQKAVLDEWNAEHPEMAMTAKEFLSRG